jgi:hypothetical protein
LSLDLGEDDEVFAVSGHTGGRDLPPDLNAGIGGGQRPESGSVALRRSRAPSRDANASSEKTVPREHIAHVNQRRLIGTNRDVPSA